MAVDSPQIKIDPYTSTVPLVQLPIPEAEATTRPAQPLQGQFGGGRGSGGLAIGDSIVKGFMQGHAFAAERKYKEATATINAADKSTEDAYQQYQDTLGSGKDPVAAQAAYKNYVETFNKAKEAKAKYVIPEKPAKGQKKGVKDEVKSFGGGIKDFFEANPHIIPQIALMTMQPKPPGQSREAREADLREKQLQGQVELQGKELTGEDLRQKGEKERQEAAASAEQRAEQQRQVETAGGIEAVLKDEKADPALKQTARQMKFAALDAQTPEAQFRNKMFQDVQTGESKNWTPEQRVFAGKLGLVQEPQEVTRVGKNGHQEQILVDPTTNQPVPGSKPLDLGPPAWASEFYAKRGAEKTDIERAVKADPVAFGITPSADPKAMKAAIDARVDRLVVEHEFGIKTLAGSLGKTGYEIQRDNGYLEDVSKELSSRFDAKHPEASFDWPGGGRVDLSKDQVAGILNQFVTDPTETSQGGVGGVRAFRDVAKVQDGKDAGAAERDRQWAYQFVKGRMMARKGKDALTSEQADELLKNTALGRPLSSGGMTSPPAPPSKSLLDRTTGFIHRMAYGGMTPPPSGPTKMYMVPGYSEPVELTDDEAKKAKAANIALEPVDSLTTQ